MVVFLLLWRGGVLSMLMFTVSTREEIVPGDVCVYSAWPWSDITTIPSSHLSPVICLLSSVSVCFLFPHLPSPGWLSRPTSSFLLAEDGGWWRMVEAAPWQGGQDWVSTRTSLRQASAGDCLSCLALTVLSGHTGGPSLTFPHESLQMSVWVSLSESGCSIYSIYSTLRTGYRFVLIWLGVKLHQILKWI